VSVGILSGGDQAIEVIGHIARALHRQLAVFVPFVSALTIGLLLPEPLGLFLFADLEQQGAGLVDVRVHDRAAAVAGWTVGDAQPAMRPGECSAGVTAVDGFDEVERIAFVGIGGEIGPHPGFLAGQMDFAALPLLAVDRAANPFGTDASPVRQECADEGIDVLRQEPGNFRRVHITSAPSSPSA